MKYLKSYKIYESIDLDLDEKLKKFYITKYSINENGSIDCYQNVILSNIILSTLDISNKIPFKFNKVFGYFDISNIQLTSMNNCANYIAGSFYCSENKLTSLEYGPEYVGGSYACDHNKLETLNGCVDEVYGDFYCSDNQLTSLEFCPMQVDGDFFCSNNKLEYLDRSPFIKGDLFCCDMFKSEPEFTGSCNKLIWE